MRHKHVSELIVAQLHLFRGMLFAWAIIIGVQTVLFALDGAVWSTIWRAVTFVVLVYEVRAVNKTIPFAIGVWRIMKSFRPEPKK